MSMSDEIGHNLLAALAADIRAAHAAIESAALARCPSCTGCRRGAKRGESAVRGPPIRSAKAPGKISAGADGSVPNASATLLRRLQLARPGRGLASQSHLEAERRL
jgi:hypothetical protein